MSATGYTATSVKICDLLPTLEAVRTNCHIADAKHATDYTLCVYLLKMREYFRWEHSIPFNETLPHKQLTSWLTERESHWESLEQSEFGKIPVQNTMHDPFDAETINQSLNDLGFVYSSGYGRNMKPVFFSGFTGNTRGLQWLHAGCVRQGICARPCLSTCHEPWQYHFHASGITAPHAVGES